MISLHKLLQELVLCARHADFSTCLEISGTLEMDKSQQCTATELLQSALCKVQEIWEQGIEIFNLRLDKFLVDTSTCLPSGQKTQRPTIEIIDFSGALKRQEQSQDFLQYQYHFLSDLFVNEVVEPHEIPKIAKFLEWISEIMAHSISRGWPGSPRKRPAEGHVHKLRAVRCCSCAAESAAVICKLS